MDTTFAAALDDWTPFYALAGAAAATLLGLLFVAASLRLAIFRNPDTADVSYFATFIFANMLGAMIVPGLILIPHQHRFSLAIPLAILGVIGLVMGGTLIRLWARLNPATDPPPRVSPWTLPGKLMMAGMASPAIMMLAAAWLLAADHASALPVLALSEGLLLVIPTGSAWLLVTHATVQP
ncbi:MAG: hypothetical protein QM692_16705 [Thermomicrobiales bacterium]